MEDKIGDIVTLLPFGIKTRVVEDKDKDCSGCYYQIHNLPCWEYMDDGTRGDCRRKYRKDRKNIIYKPLLAEEEEK